MKVLVIQQRYGIGDMVILLSYIHAISKKFKHPITLLAKENSKAKDLFHYDNYINEVINLEKKMDGIKGILKLSKEIKKILFFLLEV